MRLVTQLLECRMLPGSIVGSTRFGSGSARVQPSALVVRSLGSSAAGITGGHRWGLHRFGGSGSAGAEVPSSPPVATVMAAAAAAAGTMTMLFGSPTSHAEPKPCSGCPPVVAQHCSGDCSSGPGSLGGEEEAAVKTPSSRADRWAGTVATTASIAGMLGSFPIGEAVNSELLGAVIGAVAAGGAAGLVYRGMFGPSGSGSVAATPDPAMGDATKCCDAGTELTTADAITAAVGEVTLYQYQPCPFCNKVRAFLDYANIPWHSVEVDPLLKAEIKFSSYKKVPIVMVEGVEQIEGRGESKQVNNSSTIIDVLNAKLPAGATKPHQPSCATKAAQVARWRKWVDDCLVHLLVANIYRTWDEALQAFDYLLVHGNFPEYQRHTSRYAGALVMYGLSHFKLNKQYGITMPRDEIYSALDQYVEAVGENDFLLQSAAPTLADVELFGVLRAIKDYPTFADIMANSKIGPWYRRMEVRVGETSVASLA